MKAPFLPVVLLLAGCSAPEPRTTSLPVPSPAEDTPAAKPPAPPPEMPAPAALAEGDRWFVAVREGAGPEPVAERSRRVRGDGFVREEVTWSRSFGDLAQAEHGTAQVFALLLDAKGLSASLLDGAGRPAGDARLEIAAPFRAGTAWMVPIAGGTFEARIAGIEPAGTPGGPVEALRVEVRSPGARPLLMTTWYDAGLRPVRAEIRRGPSEILESRAALASAAPTIEECRAAVEWARKNLPAPAR